MSKISENKIPSINADWGKDLENGLPYSGQSVQEFIKEQLNSKYGYFYYDENNNRYLVFTNEDSKDKYFEDPKTNGNLLLTTFDAPFNYSARIEMISDSYIAALVGTTGNNLEFKFATEDKSGNSVGENVDCTIVLTNQGVKQTITKIFTAEQGREGVMIELDNYLSEGTNNVSITIKGANTLAATTVSVVYQIVNLKLTDSFDISRVYKQGDILEVSCVVEGAGTKIIDWYLDGEQLPFEIVDEINYITAYTVNKNIQIKDLAPGVHSLQYKLRSQVGENWFSSQTLFRNFFVEGATDTVIGVATELPIGIEPVKSNVVDKLYGIIQYVPYTVKYAIYNPSNVAVNTVQVYVDDEVQATTNAVNGVENYASIMSGVFGNVPIKITVNDSVYEMESETAVSSIGVSEIADAVLNLRAFGKDNNALDKEVWTYNNYSTTFDGLYWNSQSGWVNNTMIINDGASASIDYVPFEKDPMSTGKTIEVEFATRNVVNNDDVVLDLTNNSGHGLLITASEARLTTSDNKVVSTKFKAEEENRISFVINRRESGNNAGFVFIYVNGVLSGAAEYAKTATIRCTKNIVFSGTSDILLKQIAIYDKPLSSDEILNNYILYRDSISEMLAIYNRNNVTTSDGQLSPEKLLNTLPVMYFTGLEEDRGIPYLETQTGKESTKINTRFDIDYENAQDKTKNFSLKAARVRIQGTSSSFYPRKNYRFYSAKEKDAVMYDYKGDVIEDGLYSFKDGAQPVDCWCLKTDYAESSGSHNTGTARLWNDVMKNAVINGENKLMTGAQKAAVENKFEYDVRTTIDGFPIVVFYRNSYNHPWQFLGKFNFNNDKSTPSVFGFCDVPGFDNSRMQCWEILNNGHALCNFTEYSSEYFDENWEDAFEARYDEDNPLLDDLKALCEWVHSTKGASNGIEVLDEDLMEKFKTEKWDHFDVYKMAAYYIYIMRFGAVDQTVKNSMFTSDDGEHFYFINYDNDTIFGVRNDGLLKHGPYIDRQSIDPETENTDYPYVYAGHDSVLWNNLECDDEFMEIVKTVDSALHEAGLTYSSIINMYENEQTLKWCEKVCNMDAHYKYIAPPDGRVIESLQGNRNSHRRWWVSERFNLYDAKFVTGDFKNYVVELKINGKHIPFAKITAAKRQPYGYNITNSASLVTDVLNVGDTYTFTSPENQTLQVGDPISIYSACNISELDLSGCADCAIKIDLSRINSDSVGNTLKKLIINGDNDSLDDATLVGMNKLDRLEYLDIQGLHKLGTIDLSSSLNLKTLLAKNTGLTEVKLAPGCLIERLELPTSTAAVILKDLPLLSTSNLVIDGDWANVRQIEISGCPNLTNDFDLIWNWFNNSSEIESTRSVELHGINWTNVNIDNLIELVENTNIILKGKIKLGYIDDKNKLLRLRELFNNKNIYDRNSDLYIYGFDAIYVFAPEKVLEGDSKQLELIVFSEEEGVLIFQTNPVGEEREGVQITNDGYLTTVENGLPSAQYQFVAVYVRGSDRLMNDCEVLIEKRVYPTNVRIVGDRKINTEISSFSWETDTQNITGVFTVRWSLSGSVLEFVAIKNSTDNTCVLNRVGIPETLVHGDLKVELIKWSGEVLASHSVDVSVINPNVIMTYETNPKVLQILYNAGKISDPEFLLKRDAEKLTADDFESIFANSDIETFDEFEYFTGVTELPNHCFSQSKLKSIKLHNNLRKIKDYAFQSTRLESIYIPESVTDLATTAFRSSTSLTNITVAPLNSKYFSENGCVYLIDYNNTLYIIAPGFLEYTMPSKCRAIADNIETMATGRQLRKIVLSENLTSFHGKLFLYGFDNLVEITGPATNPNLGFHNGCVYNKDFTELLYCPSGKSFDELDLHENVTSFGEYSFVANKLIETINVPESVTSLKANVFYNCSSLGVLELSSNIKTIGKMCFAGCSLLGDISCYATTAPTLGENVFGDSISSYAGKNASTKIFRYPVNSLGYDSDSWKVLNETLGFTFSKTL